MLHTSTIHRKADLDQGNIHITQDVVRAIRVLLSILKARYQLESTAEIGVFKGSYCH